MRQLRYSESAERDILDILEYISGQSSSLVAERFMKKLRRRCREIASLPGVMGRARPELGRDVRSRVFENYIIYLTYEKATMRVLRVIEAHRDIHFEDLNEGE